jgi:hypothetical protein
MRRAGVRRVGTVAGVVGVVALALGALPAAAQIIGPPEISNVSASNVGARHATVTATIEPRGSDTTYELMMRYSPCPAGAGECPQPPRVERDGHGKVAQKLATRTVRAKLVMLTKGCIYEYWIVASNASGTVESEHHSIATAGGSRPPAECKR